eukprot:TRINITY_DN11936_c0_g1_i1.p1 TRINITY_DN11936_c0_g1~~TRINITY_DN11936_c0_g1_i1.p1  ORF type:complete len:351 (+),score=113.94 TRINITY_DN11936_c0_g1_i1:89-1141(+)
MLLLEAWRWPRSVRIARWAALGAAALLLAGGGGARALAGAALGALALLRLFRELQGGLSSRPKVVVVTGAGSGLGRATAEYLVAAGDTVVAVDLAPAALADLAARCSKTDLCGRLVTLAADLTKAEQVAEVCSRIPEAVGGGEGGCVDALLNFAGVIFGGPLTELEDGKFAAVMDVNVKGTFHMTKYIFPLLRRGGRGARVGIVSSEVGHARMSAGFNAPYSMSKFAIEAMAVALKQEVSPLGVHVGVIAPGAMVTPMTANQQVGCKNDWFTQAAEKEGTRYRAALLSGSKLAYSYMQRNGHPPELVARAAHELVHSRRPLGRYLVGMSLEMWLVSLTPQCVLDLAVAKL